MTELPPTDEVVSALKYAVAPCFTAAATVYLVGRVSLSLIRRFSGRSLPLSAVIAVLAVGTALAIGNYTAGLDRPFPWVPDGKPWHFAWWAIGAMVGVELIARIPGIQFGNLLRGVTAGLAAYFAIPAFAQTEARWWIPVAGLAIAVVWGATDFVAKKYPGGSLAFALAINCGGTAAICLHAASLGFLNVATFLAAGLGACALCAWLTRSDAAAAANAASGPQIVLLLLTKHLSSDHQVPLDCFLIVGLAPLALLLLFAPGIRRMASMRFGGIAAISLVATPVAFAVLRAMIVAPYSFSLAQEEW